MSAEFDNSSEEINLDRYILAVWRAKWLILILVVASGVIAAAVHASQPAEQTASVVVRIGNVWREPIEDPFVAVQSASSRQFLEDLSNKTGISLSQLRQRYKTEPVTIGPRRIREPYAIRLSITQTNQDEALRVVKTAGDLLISRHQKLYQDAIAPHLDLQRRLEERLKQPSSQSSEYAARTEDELAEVKHNNTSPMLSYQTNIVEGPSASVTPRPGMFRTVAAAAIAAFGLGIIGAVLKAYLNKTSPRSQAAGNA